MRDKSFCDDAGIARPLPQNLEAERSILGAILLDNRVLKTAIEKVKPEEFFLDPHRRIFECMVRMEQGIDLTTLTEALDRSGDLLARISH